MDRIHKQGRFSRTVANEGKMGAYYTDPEHCAWIRKLLAFPTDKEVCCLDPAIGDGRALRIVTGTDEEGNENRRLFGVELNKETCQFLRQESFLEELLETDFIEGTIISHSSFSFCFANPPYGLREGERLEVSFLEKLIPYLSLEAVIVYVIPGQVATSLPFLRRWCSHFDTLYYYRFHESEYRKYKQVVLFGRKREMRTDEEEIGRMVNVNVEELEELPTQFQGEQVIVHGSAKDSIRMFLSKEFQPERVVDTVKASPLHEILERKMRVPRYGTGTLERPPIIPCNNQLYLLAMCGGGEGLAGTEDNRDLHLQRGVVRNVCSSGYELDDRGKMIEVERMTSKVSFNLIEADGTIRELA